MPLKTTVADQRVWRLDAEEVVSTQPECLARPPAFDRSVEGTREGEMRMGAARLPTLARVRHISRTRGSARRPQRIQELNR